MVTNTALATLFTVGENPNALADYSEATNAYVDIINKIGRQIIRGVEGFNNPFTRFKKRFDTGDTIETVFIESIQGEAFDLAEDNPFRINNPSVISEYHTLTNHIQYPITLRDLELQKALLPGGTFGSFLASVMASIKYGSQLDEFNANKLFSFPVNNSAADISTLEEYDFYGKKYIYTDTDYPLVTNDNKLAFATKILNDINLTIDDLQFPNTANNTAGTINDTPKERQILLIQKYWYRYIKMNVLADTFNKDFKKIDLDEANIIIIDEVSPSTNASEVASIFSTVWGIFDEREYLYYFKSERWASQANVLQHYVNNAYDIDRVISYPTFANSVAGIYELVPAT